MIRKRREKIISLLLLLSNIILFGSGFSSWIINTGKNYEINFAVGDISSIDYGGAAYYIKNSEKGFEFYLYNDEYFFTKTNISFQIKVRPDLLKTLYYGNDISVRFGLQYEFDAGQNYEIFTNNEYIKSPQNILINSDVIKNKILFSNKINYEKEIVSSSITKYKLYSDLLLYSDYKSSIYSIFKDLQSNNSYIYLNVIFCFEDINLNNDANFKDVSFKIFTSLNGVFI